MRTLLAVSGVCLGLLTSPYLRADGTLSTEELLVTLSQSNPKLVQTLRDGFDLDKNAEGAIIGRAVNPALAGTRIGPYKLHGRLRKSQSPVELVITLNTAIVFSDRRGHKTASVATATSVTETLKNIQIETASDVE
jgi:hypothetical protein